MECLSALEVGTEISAKFRGAYCEAVVKRIVQSRVDLHVRFLRPGKGEHTVSHKNVRGNSGAAKVGQTCDVKHPEDGQYHKAIIGKVTDYSVYLVEFDDGDVKQLRRNHIRPKGQRHYINSATITNMPLTDPDKFAHQEAVDSTPLQTRSSPHTPKHAAKQLLSRPSKRSPVRVGPAPADRMPMFVSPTDNSAVCYWRVALVIPTAEINSDMGLGNLHNDYVAIRYFDDSKCETVAESCLRPFGRETALFRLFMKTQPTFKNDAGVQRALSYVDTSALPNGFAWPQLTAALLKKTPSVPTSPAITNRKTSSPPVLVNTSKPNKTPPKSGPRDTPALRRSSVSSDRSATESEKPVLLRKRSSVDDGVSTGLEHSNKRTKSMSESSDTNMSRRTSDQDSVSTRTYPWRYRVGDKVWSTSYMDGKIYEAKVIQRKLMSTSRDSRRISTTTRNPLVPHYLMRYVGWNDKYSEWIQEEQLYDEHPFKPRRKSKQESMSSDASAAELGIGETDLTPPADSALIADVDYALESGPEEAETVLLNPTISRHIRAAASPDASDMVSVAQNVNVNEETADDIHSAACHTSSSEIDAVPPVSVNKRAVDSPDESDMTSIAQSVNEETADAVHSTACHTSSSEIDAVVFTTEESTSTAPPPVEDARPKPVKLSTSKKQKPKQKKKQLAKPEHAAFKTEPKSVDDMSMVLADESSTCTIISSRTEKRSLDTGITVTKEEFKVSHTHDRDGVTIADSQLHEVMHILEDAKSNTRTFSNHVVLTGAQDLGQEEVEQRMAELRAQYLKHKEALLRLERKRRQKKESQ